MMSDPRIKIGNAHDALNEMISEIVNGKAMFDVSLARAYDCISDQQVGEITLTDCYVVDTEGPFLYVGPTPQSEPLYCFGLLSILDITL